MSSRHVPSGPDSPFPHRFERPDAGAATPALDTLLAGAPEALAAVLAALAAAATHGVEHVHVEPADGHWRLRHRHDDGLEETLLGADDALPAALARLAPRCRAFTVRLGSERRLVALRALEATRGETFLLTLHDGAQSPPTLDALGLAPSDLAALREHLGRPGGWLAIGTAGPLDGARLVRAVAQEIVSPTRALVCAESGPHPALARVVQVDADALGDPDVALDADAVLLAADPPAASLATLAARAAGELFVARSVRARRPSDVLRELLALGLSPAWIAHGVPLVIMRHRIRLLCHACRRRAPADCPSGHWLGTLGATRVHDVAAWLESSLATRYLAGDGCADCDGRAHSGTRDLTALTRLDGAARDALRAGDVERALALVDRPGTIATRLGELVARGDIAAAEAERHLRPRY